MTPLSFVSFDWCPGTFNIQYSSSCEQRGNSVVALLSALPASSALSLASAGPFMKLSAVRRLALAGSLSASVALGLQHGRDARPFAVDRAARQALFAPRA